MTYLGGRTFRCDGRTFRQSCGAEWRPQLEAWLATLADFEDYTPPPETLALRTMQAAESWRGVWLAWTFDVDTGTARCPRHRIVFGSPEAWEPHPSDLPLATFHAAACDDFREVVQAARARLGMPPEPIGVPRGGRLPAGRVRELSTK